MAKVNWTNIDPAMKKSFKEANDAEKNYVLYEISNLAQQINDSNLSDDARQILIDALRSRGSTQSQAPDDWHRKLPSDVREALEKEERLTTESKLSIEEQLNGMFGLQSKNVF